MKTRRIVSLLMIGTLVAGTSLPLTACSSRKKGPAQRAGEKIDRATDKVEDALDPKGPAEKAGRKVDRAVDELR